MSVNCWVVMPNSPTSVHHFVDPSEWGENAILSPMSNGYQSGLCAVIKIFNFYSA